VQTSALKLEWKRRTGGDGKTQRDYLDFVIDGESLSEKIGGDLISCLGWLAAEENAEAANRIMLKAASELPGSRYALYVCPECGELGCGAVTAIIERVNDKIIWRDFAFQNDYDGEKQPVKEVDKFIFDRAQYRNALRSAL
jgi:predicted RNA-binding Zn-ribbon protein involved in translation (DUF1610 family)